MSDRVRAEIVVRGRVQGVFFRASAQQEGLQLGLTGEVRNLPDGSVEAIVEGEREAVDDFVAWCRRGPPSADVEDVDVKLRAPRNEFRTFLVAR
ncbi:MAG TPA: acylphosphatase [Myxococcales bacterium]|nr:acylphosphatase [Myxococcales bacterium]